MTGSPRQTALDLLVSVVAPGARVVPPADLVAAGRRHHRRRAVRQGRHRAVGGLRRPHRRRRHELLAARRRPHRRDRRGRAHDERDQRRPQPARPRREVAQPPRLPRDGGRQHGRRVAAASRPRRRRRRCRRASRDRAASSTTSASTPSTAAPLANGRALEPGHPAFGRELSASRADGAPARPPRTSPPDATTARAVRSGRRRLRDPDGVARRVAERAVARAPRLVDGLLEHLGAGGANGSRRSRRCRRWRTRASAGRPW